MRSWLNGTFINTAFSAAEQSAIQTTIVDNSKEHGNNEWDTDGGNNTNDKLFLLSFAEAGVYFSDDDDRMCAPTDYAIAQGAYTIDKLKTNGRATCFWWLRSPGYSQSYAMFVDDNGSRGYIDAHNANVCVRPAFWLNLESDIF